MTLAIDQALVQSFIDGAFGLPIAHENAGYIPTAGVAFSELRVFLNPERPFTLAGKNSITGLLQVVLSYPTGNGAIAAKTMAETISDTYPIGRKITYGGQSLEITEKQRASAAIVNGWYRLALRFNFVAYTPR